VSERVLRIEGLSARVGKTEILHGIDLEIRPGEVHAVMGPNGSGKSTLSHVLMGRPGYEVTEGSVILDGVDLLGLPTWERARAGLFLALQHPTEVPGVSLESVVTESARAAGRSTEGVNEILVAEATRSEGTEAVAEVHRQYRRDLVPIRQSVTLYRRDRRS